MDSKVRVGVIGTSEFAEGSHLRPLASHPQAEIAALCGRNRARAAELAARYGGAQVFTDHCEMLRSVRLDAVVIVTPDHLHYPMTMDSLKAGKHVLCEKTLAMNQFQAREMVDLADRLHLVHMTNFPFRAHPAFQRLLALSEQGYAGRLIFGRVDFLASFARSRAYQWRADRRYSNGMVADLGAHVFDLARQLFGEVTAVSARTAFYFEKDSQKKGERLDQVNDSAVVLLEFGSGAQITCQMSTAAHVGQQVGVIQAEAHGTGGVLRLDLPMFSAASLSGANQEGSPLQPLDVPDEYWLGTDPALEPAARFDSLKLCAPVGDRLFIDAILGKDHPLPTFYDGWKAQVVIDAAIQSAQIGSWEPVRG